METIDEVIERLAGSCTESFDMDLYSMEDLEYLDDNIFMCEQCGWWCWIHDLSESEEGLICNDCYEE